MSDSEPRLDIREQLARIDAALAQAAESRALLPARLAQAEAQTAESRTLMGARLAQLEADTARRRQEMRIAPWLLMISGMTAGAALIGAGFALAKLFT
jgi:predicted anti-sigma-YlaC factor YlaD